MYKPVSFFIKKKFKDTEINFDDVNSKWGELSDKKKLKYIRKAEKAYDAYIEVGVNFFLFIYFDF